MERAALLKLIDVSKQFQSPGGGETISILRQIDLEAQSGDSLAIIGPSGSGKSTLLNLIGSLDRPSSGKILLEGQDLSGLNEADLAQVRNQRIGFVFQSHFLLPQCTVFENVLTPTLVTKNAELKAKAPDRARELLERVGLGQRLNHWPGQLSGGERQRVAVVRALINKPALVLADEPTGALDRASAQSLGDLLVQLNNEQGVTLIVVTHALELANRMKRVFELRDGKLISAGSA